MEGINFQIHTEYVLKDNLIPYLGRGFIMRTSRRAKVYKEHTFDKGAENQSIMVTASARSNHITFGKVYMF